MILFWTRKLQIKKKTQKANNNKKTKQIKQTKKTQAFIHNIIKI